MYNALDLTAIATPFLADKATSHILQKAEIGGKRGFRGDHSVYPRNSGGRAAVIGTRYCVPAASFCVSVFTVDRGHGQQVPTTDSLSQL